MASRQPLARGNPGEVPRLTRPGVAGVRSLGGWMRSKKTRPCGPWEDDDDLVGGDWKMTFMFPYDLGMVIIIPIDSYFSEGLIDQSE